MILLVLIMFVVLALIAVSAVVFFAIREKNQVRDEDILDSE